MSEKDSDKRHNLVAHMLSDMMDDKTKQAFSLAGEIRTFLHSVKDEGTNIDSAGGLGGADLWVKVQGVEYLIQVAENKAVYEANKAITDELQSLRDEVARLKGQS